jgi:glycosyltransferase involved in cell wall biosynthesis
MYVKRRHGRLRRLLRRRGIRRCFSDSTLSRLQYREDCRALKRHILTEVRTETPLIVEWPSYQGQCDWSGNGICHVLRIHGATAMPEYSGDPTASRYRDHEIATARHIRNWIGVSHWSLDTYHNVVSAQPEQQTVVPNPVNCDMFHPSSDPAAGRTVLYAGTLCDRKGDNRLAIAANRFLTEFPDARLSYIGRHSQSRADLIYSLIQPELHDRVDIRDNITQAELAAAMRSAAVFTMPSRGETFGMVYAEAMASGVPVVAGNKTGIPETVPNGQAGLLVDADDTDAIADAVSSLLRAPEMRRSMGAAGRGVAMEQYSVDACVTRTLDFFEQCLHSSG